MDMKALTNEKLAFRKEYKGFEMKAFWGDEPDARIEITRDGKPYKTFSYPSYKIFNLAAHFIGIVDGELEGSDIGYRIAGSTGLGGVIMPKKE
jgi:hypothetical protein